MRCRNSPVLVLVVLSGCFIDPNGRGATPDVDSGPPGGDASRDTGREDGLDGDPDGLVPDRDVGPEGGGAVCNDGLLRCVGDSLQICRGGQWVTHEECALGCVETDAPPRCLRLVPSNVPAEYLDDATGDVVVDTDITLNTDTCSADFPNGAPRFFGYPSDAPSLCVVAMESLLIQQSRTIDVDGSNPVVFLVRGAVTIAGEIDVSANKATPGPGGLPGAVDDQTALGSCGGGNGQSHTRSDSGGGGGGHGGNGGGGGPAVGDVEGDGDDVAGGAGGEPVVTTDGILVPLRGGCGGGAGGYSGSAGTAGGGGGGALQLSSATSILVTESGVLHAGGGGGGGGNLACSGGGGGAGGGILIEAPVVRVAASGRVAANGGGGGGGGGNSTAGADGNDGLPSASAAQGGIAGGPGGNAGGGGGFRNSPNGQAAAAATYDGGGGGGAAGLIKINTRQGTSPDRSGAVISPNSSPAFTEGFVTTE